MGLYPQPVTHALAPLSQGETGVVVIKEADFVNQEVINNSFVLVEAVENNVHQVVVIKEADSAKQDNKHQNITHNKVNNHSNQNKT